MFIVLVNDEEGILNELVLVTVDLDKAKAIFLQTCSEKLHGAEYSEDEKDAILSNGYEQVGAEGVVMLIDTSNCVSDEELRDQLTKQPSGDMTVATIVQEGELDLSVGMTVDEIIEACASNLDSACSWDIQGQILFMGSDGKWYTVTTESIIGEANPRWVEDTLAETEAAKGID